MRRRKKNELIEEDSGSWMTTFSDLVSLLLTFFIMLFAMSTIDAQKWKDITASLRGNFGIIDNVSDIIGVLPDDGLIRNTESDEDKSGENNVDINDGGYIDNFIKLYNDIEKYMIDNDIQGEVELSEEQTEILLRFKEYILFDSGKAEIKNQAKAILDDVANVLLTYDSSIQRIRVEGHTDSKPINTYLFPTNWELSGGRAARVVRYFQENHSISGSKLSFAGYGEHYPIDVNTSEEGRSRNRRVDILIVRTINDPIALIGQKE